MFLFFHIPIPHPLHPKSLIMDVYLPKILANGPKYREPQSIHWKYNLKLLINGLCGGLCQKMEKTGKKDEFDTLSE
jgi:hypothetical protein